MYENLMTNHDQDVFIPLVPSVLGAMLMSKVSRQKQGFREDLIQMVKEDMLNLPDQNYFEQFKNSVVVANGFMEKWGVNYGHSSIKELDTLQMCIENKSRWFTELIETVQASSHMSYIEYSLRYNPPTRYYTPIEFDVAPELKVKYTEFCDRAFKTYEQVNDLFFELFKLRYPDNSDRDNKLKAFENARNVLPLSTLANMGIQSNLRAFCDAISELYAHEGLNAEVVSTAELMKNEAEKVSVGMVKHTEASDYQKSLINTYFTREDIVNPYKIYDSPVTHVSDDLIGDMSLLDRLGDLNKISRFDELPTAFKTIGKTVDVLLSEAAHHQAIRHRAFNFHTKMPDVKYGILLPEELGISGNETITNKIKDLIKDTYQQSIDVYESIYDAGYKGLAPYAVLNCNMRRLKFFGNLYGMAHFITLRKEKHAQDEIRTIAADIHEGYKDVEMLISGLRLDKND